MNHWAKAAITMAIAVALAYIVMSLARDEDVQSEVPVPAASQYDERLKDLEREALDAAYQQQAVHLFMQWMKDPTGQPARMTNGFAQARRAYIDAAVGIEARK